MIPRPVIKTDNLEEKIARFKEGVARQFPDVDRSLSLAFCALDLHLIAAAVMKELGHEHSTACPDCSPRFIASLNDRRAKERARARKLDREDPL